MPHNFQTRFRVHWWHQNNLAFVSVTKRWRWLCFWWISLDFVFLRNLAHFFGQLVRYLMKVRWWFLPSEQPKRLICVLFVTVSSDIYSLTFCRNYVTTYDHLSWSFQHHLHCTFLLFHPLGMPSTLLQLKICTTLFPKEARVWLS